MEQKQILNKLRNDEDYYGEFGRRYLSNSDISALLNNPLAYGQPSKPSAAFLVGGYFHTAILEPDKLKKYKVVESSTRNTKAYKEISGGELCLLQHEVDKIELMTDKMLSNPHIVSELCYSRHFILYVFSTYKTFANFVA